MMRKLPVAKPEKAEYQPCGARAPAPPSGAGCAWRGRWMGGWWPGLWGDHAIGCTDVELSRCTLETYKKNNNDNRGLNSRGCGEEVREGVGSARSVVWNWNVPMSPPRPCRAGGSPPSGPDLTGVRLACEVRHRCWHTPCAELKRFPAVPTMRTVFHQG